ncbi:uncharacterized protein LOC132697233 isoform X2 [Cylas formicarius]|uniref:uncharacterized protein LOC132697233 isoform X2 n=1 Tax=Cylas formicarius TaxID=197179 RepID=UPI0029586752|nr:uncharacterized protein LOC132697233 isoform X2 [Cylas formicarius]
MWKLSQVLLISLSLVVSEKDTDEGRPYEFGFTIDGEQHRYEKKDEKGIVQGEFGFITADGIYHVTVYATDENGNFKILSMRNLRISAPLDGSPFKGEISPEANKYRKQAGLGLLPEPAAPNPLMLPDAPPKQSPEIQKTTSRAPYVFTTQSTIKPACAGCGYVTTPKPVPGQKFPFQNSIFQKPDREQPQKNDLNSQPEQGSIQSNGVGPQPLKPQYQSTKGFQNTQYPSLSHGLINSRFESSATKDDGNGDSGSQHSTSLDGVPQDQQFVGPPSPAVFQPTGNLDNVPQSQQFAGSPSPTGVFGSQSSGNLDGLPQGQQFPESSATGGLGAANQQSSRNPKEMEVNPLSIPNPDDVRQQVQQEVKDFVGIGQRGSATSKQSGFPPISVSDSVIHVGGKNPQDIPIKDKFPGMEDGLPEGVNEKDVKDILYKFHYTVGFHGHYEKGLKNGAKIGGYFVNGRDGISRVVTYIADENGYRPKIKLINLGLDSEETPKEATEKSFGLKSFEFVWYPIK